jgi:hypothetical protein
MSEDYVINCLTRIKQGLADRQTEVEALIAKAKNNDECEHERVQDAVDDLEDAVVDDLKKQISHIKSDLDGF